jgi:hypothetical protein
MNKERIALFMCASHCQGGHSGAGAAAAEALGITFPITMKKLANRARKEGLDSKSLWPWYPIKVPDLLPPVTSNNPAGGE